VVPGDVRLQVLPRALDPVRVGRVRREEVPYSATGELVAEIARAFTELVERLDLTTVHRVAATLVRSTERDVMCRRKHTWLPASDGLRVDHEEMSASFDADEDDGLASWFDRASLERWAETQHGSVLGLVPGLSFDEEGVARERRRRAKGPRARPAAWWRSGSGSMPIS